MPTASERSHEELGTLQFDNEHPPDPVQLVILISRMGMIIPRRIQRFFHRSVGGTLQRRLALPIRHQLIRAHSQEQTRCYGVSTTSRDMQRSLSESVATVDLFKGNLEGNTEYIDVLPCSSAQKVDLHYFRHCRFAA